MNRQNKFFNSALLSIFLLPFCLLSREENDPYLWLEEIEGEKAMEWVNTQNDAAVKALTSYSEYAVIKNTILEILDSQDRIPEPEIKGEFIYNFWQDKKNPRGLWRRTPVNAYIAGAAEWETLLDMDALSVQEGEKWTYSDADFLYPDYDLCMLALSKGGSDAVEIREFDLLKKKFVEDGFFLPEAKGSVSWIDRNTLLVSTDFGEGTVTPAGYPRLVKIWKRGTPLGEAKPFFEGGPKDMGVWGNVENTPERKFIEINHFITFFDSRVYIMDAKKLIRLDLPADAQFHGIFKNQMLVALKSDWTVAGTTYKQGALIGIDYDQFVKGGRQFDTIFEPDDRSSINSLATTKNVLLLSTLTQVRSELVQYCFTDGKWIHERINTPDYGSIAIETADDRTDRCFITYENFLTPASLYYLSGMDEPLQVVKRLPPFFDADQFQVDQFETASKDGTKIPYFIVSGKNLKPDGNNPVLLYGYGGFEVSEFPEYLPVMGSIFLERGGVYVCANIRGGGEFGPKWHQAALKEKRQNAYDDFYAVAEDLIARNITSPRHLGIMGASNGGLLVGVAFTQRPDLFHAAVCGAPLLDMKRFNKLLAGASWMAEYGDPDIPEEWAYIEKYSPYHHVSDSAAYPKVLFTTTTRDDRVHPGHARKMAAKMEDQGHEVFYFENTEGGHGSGVTSKQVASMMSLEYCYLLMMLR